MDPEAVVGAVLADDRRGRPALPARLARRSPARDQPFSIESNRCDAELLSFEKMTSSWPSSSRSTNRRPASLPFGDSRPRPAAGSPNGQLLNGTRRSTPIPGVGSLELAIVSSEISSQRPSPSRSRRRTPRSPSWTPVGNGLGSVDEPVGASSVRPSNVPGCHVAAVLPRRRGACHRANDAETGTRRSGSSSVGMREIDRRPRPLLRQPEPRLLRVLVADHHVQVPIAVHVEQPDAVIPPVRCPAAAGRRAGSCPAAPAPRGSSGT